MHLAEDSGAGDLPEVARVDEGAERHERRGPRERGARDGQDADRDAEEQLEREDHLGERAAIDQLFQARRLAVDAGHRERLIRPCEVAHRPLRGLAPPTLRANSSPIGVATPSFCAALVRSMSPSIESFLAS